MKKKIFYSSRGWKTFLAFVFVVSLICQGTNLALADTSSIPSPAQFHGYELGTTYTITAALYEYYRELARLSPRVDYLEYGRTIQGRPLPMLLISSEKNLNNKENIRNRIMQLTQVTKKITDNKLNEIISDTPAVVWFFIVDADEEAGVEVLQEIAYDLATRDDPDAQNIRDNVLLIMTPLTNPDSHARYTTWHKLYDVDGASLDPYAVENRAHWGMNTDGNAYGIDVNRDFGWFVTPEMQALARKAMYWHPQFWLDIHSGPNVLFMPPFPPPHHPLWSKLAPKWWKAVAKKAHENFGPRGWSFNSQYRYEGVTSIGFATSWGMLGPGIASFLYESFGGRPGKTEAFRRSDGTIATMRMAMDRHYMGMWSMLQVASEQREELLQDSHKAVIEAVDEALSSPVRGVVIPADGSGVDPYKVKRLINRLTLQNVKVEHVKEPLTIKARSFYKLDDEKSHEFSKGSYLIDFVQPQAKLVRALLDPTIDYSNPQVQLPYDRMMPYYDMTWQVLPFIFGVPAFALSESVEIPLETVEQAVKYNGSIKKLEREEPPYAYVLPPGLESNYRIAIRLMREGYRLRVFRSWFRIGTTRYPKGTLAALRSRNPEGLGKRIEQLAEDYKGFVVEIEGPYTDAGVAFGDVARLMAVPTPLVAVVADWPVNQDHTFGGIRNVLEADFGFAFTPVMLDTINQRDLSKYTAVVLPHAGMNVRGGPGFNQGYKGILNIENLRKYVLSGGTLIVVHGAAEVVAEDEILGHDINFKGWAKYTNGATLRANWNVKPDPEDPVFWKPGLDQAGFPLIASGYVQEEFAAPAVYPVMLEVKEGSDAKIMACYSKDADRLLLDGYMLESDKEMLAGYPFVIIQPVGRGKVIYFASDPTFRGYWYELNILFLNSIIFGPLL